MKGGAQELRETTPVRRGAQRPLMVALDGGAPLSKEIDGETVLNEILDLIRCRVPLIPEDDPARAHLVGLRVALAEALGRPPVAAVRVGPLLG
jgi:hypothetical protein